MAYKIIWTERACSDLATVVRYIARHNPDAAENMGYGIYERAQVLLEFPESGSTLPELRDPDWRQLIFRSYRIVYHLNREAKIVEVIRVWHGARGEVHLS
jgi:toxin ParE1/3/4